MKQKLYNVAKATLVLGILSLALSLGKFQFYAADSTGGMSSLALVGVIVAGGLILISIILIAIAMSL